MEAKNRTWGKEMLLTWGEEEHYLFLNTHTFVTALFFQWLFPFLFLWLEWILLWGDITLHLLEGWTSQIQEVPWSTHPPTPDTTPTKWSIHQHTLPTVAINTTRWHATALYHFKTYINRVFLFCLIRSKCLYSVKCPPLELIAEMSPQIKHPYEEGSLIRKVHTTFK